MKKFIICIVLIISMAAFASCGERQAGKSDVEFLTSSEYWWFYDEVTGESEKMSFHDDFTFYWGCECGEPIGNTDCFELYDYDKETRIIKLYNDYDDYSMEMKVLDYSDYHLLLEQDGEIKDYTCDDLGLEVTNSEKFFNDYNMVGWIVDANNGQVVVGPYDYDGDFEYPDNAMKAYDLAEDITFFDVQIKKIIYEDESESCEETYNKMSRENGMEALDGGFGFIWFNEDMEIEKFTYFGEIINWE